MRSDGEESLMRGAAETLSHQHRGEGLGQGGFSSSFDLWRAQVKALLHSESWGVSQPSPTDPWFHVPSQKGSGWKRCLAPSSPAHSQPCSAKGHTGCPADTAPQNIPLEPAAQGAKPVLPGQGPAASTGTRREACSGQTQYANY